MKGVVPFCGIGFLVCGCECVWKRGRDWRCKGLNGHDDFNGYVGEGRGDRGKKAFVGSKIV